MARSEEDGSAAQSGGPAGNRLGIEDRQERILEHVRRRGYASIEAMSARFAVSTQTIRRDIKRLSALELLERYHGGAGLPPGSDKLAYSNRKVRNALAKQAIAEAVARSIPNGGSVFIDIGTTMEAVAEALLDHEGLTVVTNHIRVATILSQRRDFVINLAGGTVRHRDQAVTGEAAADFIRRFKVGYGIFSIGCIDNDGELLDYDYRDSQCSLAAMANSRRIIFAADDSKFNSDAMVRLAHLSDIDRLVTNSRPPDDILAKIKAHEVELTVAQSGKGSPP